MIISNKNMMFLIDVLEQSTKIPMGYNYIFTSSVEQRKKVYKEIIRGLVESQEKYELNDENNSV